MIRNFIKKKIMEIDFILQPKQDNILTMLGFLEFVSFNFIFKVEQNSLKKIVLVEEENSYEI